jgi:hypothetical protein
MENIDEVALYIKGKVPTIYAVVGSGYGGRGIKGRRRIFKAMEFIGCWVFFD